MELWGEGEAATPSTMPRLRLSLRDSIGSGGLKQVLGLGELERKRGPRLVVCSPDASSHHMVGAAGPGVGSSMSLAFSGLLTGHFYSMNLVPVSAMPFSLLSPLAQPLRPGITSSSLPAPHYPVKI